MDDLLSLPDPHPWAALAIDYWWEQRIREGHTPETAQFMLGLLLRPNMKVAYDTATHRPDLIGVSDTD